jgi:hypothetical protein
VNTLNQTETLRALSKSAEDQTAGVTKQSITIHQSIVADFF